MGQGLREIARQMPRRNVELLRQTKLETNMAEFWFMMQIAMVCGFVTSYPVNWWLIRTGLKKKM